VVERVSLKRGERKVIEVMEREERGVEKFRRRGKWWRKKALSFNG